jgi:hypothetical protein
MTISELSDSLNDIDARYMVPKKITVARWFFDELIKNFVIVKIDRPTLASLYGVPLEITDDPMAPNWAIDYEEHDPLAFRFLGRFPAVGEKGNLRVDYTSLS